MRARVKETGKIVKVQDLGSKICPRFWSSSRGYMVEELELLTGVGGALVRKHEHEKMRRVKVRELEVFGPRRVVWDGTA